MLMTRETASGARNLSSCPRQNSSTKETICSNEGGIARKKKCRGPCPERKNWDYVVIKLSKVKLNQRAEK